MRHLESCALSSDSSQCERSCMDPTKASQPTAVMVASQTTSSFMLSLKKILTQCCTIALVTVRVDKCSTIIRVCIVVQLLAVLTRSQECCSI